MELASNETSQIVQGLRDRDEFWLENTLKRALGRHDEIPSGAKTESAEAALGLGACVYWYLESAHRAFARVVLLSQRPSSDKFPHLVSPFDTGGLHNGRFSLLGLTSSRAISQYSWRGDEAILLFREWTQACFTVVCDYKRGVAPSQHYAREFTPGAHGDVRDWIWEMRVSKRDSVGLKPQHLVATEADWWAIGGSSRGVNRLDVNDLLQA